MNEEDERKVVKIGKKEEFREEGGKGAEERVKGKGK